jgi:methionyl-tRNA formyltransferase
MGARLVFFGTPQVAARALEALASGGFDVVAVVSQPDRPVGRSRTVQPTPAKGTAERLGLPVLQPESARDPGLFDYLRGVAPDLFTVVAYGNFLPRKLLEVPRLAALNLHFSLLPEYRGAAPVNWALVDGVERTGVTVQRMVKRMDAGDVVLQREVAVGPDETAPELFGRLTDLGVPLLAEAVRLVCAGNDTRAPQDETHVTFAPLLKREHGGLDFTRPARVLYDRWRGLLPWPGVFCLLGGETLKVHRCWPAPDETAEQPGTVFRFTDGGWLTACGDGTVLEISEVQVGGGGRMQARDFANGRRLKPAFHLTSVEPAPRA